MNRQEKLTLYNSVNLDRIAELTILNFDIPGYSFKDLKQEAMLVAWKSLDGYDLTKGALNTYLSKVILNRTIILLKQSKAKKRSKVIFVNDSFLKRFPDEKPNIEESVCEAESIGKIKEIVKKVRESLNGIEKEIVDCHLEFDPATTSRYKLKKVTPSTVCTQLGISTNRYLRAIKKIKRSMKVQRIFP